MVPEIASTGHQPLILRVSQMGWPSSRSVYLSNLIRRLPIDSSQSTALRLLANDNENPVLSIAARWSPDSRIQHLGDQFLGNRVRLQPPQCTSRVHASNSPI